MLDTLNELCLRVMDVVLGWALALSPDFAIFTLALLTAGVLLLARLWCTNQDLLRRCDADRKVLARRAKAAAREGGDAAKALATRLKQTKQTISMKAMGQEWKPLLVSLLPILVIATWAFGRLEFRPPLEGEEVRVVAHYPVGAVGQIAHLVPQEGLTAKDGWVRTVEMKSTPDGQKYGTAEWVVSGKARTEDYPIEIRMGAEAYRHSLAVGRKDYSMPVRLQRAGSLEHAVELQMRPLKPLGFVPGLPAIFLPAWLVAYLAIAIALVPVTKRVFGVH